MRKASVQDSPCSPSQRWRWQILATLAAVVLLSACGQQRGQADEDDTAEEVSFPVEVVASTRQRLSAAYFGTASLTAENESEVVAQTSGILLELLVEEGDMVSEGQVLARLDADRHRLEVERAVANLRRLEGEFRRSQELFARNLTSSEAHDRVRYDLDTQRAAADMARLDLSYTEIKAPIAGVVAQRMVNAGNLIQTNQSLFRVVSFEPLLAVLNVPERELARLRAGQDVVLQVDALPGERFNGTVARVSPVVDAGSGTFRVTCEFRGQGDSLKAGMFGRIGIVYDVRDNALVIPREAVGVEDGISSVFTVEDGAAARRVISTGYSEGNWIEVVEGLQQGEQVVTVGRNSLREGVKVQVINAPVEPAAAAAVPPVAAEQGSGVMLEDVEQNAADGEPEAESEPELEPEPDSESEPQSESAATDTQALDEDEDSEQAAPESQP